MPSLCDESHLRPRSVSADSQASTACIVPISVLFCLLLHSVSQNASVSERRDTQAYVRVSDVIIMTFSG